RQHESGTPDSGVVTAHRNRADRALERGIPVADVDVTKAALEAKGAIAAAPAVLRLAARIRGRGALIPRRQTAAEPFFPFKTDFAARCLQEVRMRELGVGRDNRPALFRVHRVLHIYRAEDLDRARARSILRLRRERRT